ncbi:MAG TPA: glycosyltransferase, partial [Planctomycetota bacterium]|nr:glycosyltransferase [Planctomycetota bacterium]
KGPLELVYFGRLTPYKGVDRCIAAVALAAKQAGVPVRLHVIGAGEQEPSLRQLARWLGVEDQIVFHGALPFGPRLFEALYPMHLALAAPLSEDTPRSALDALASAVPILAFDTGYYADLAKSGAVECVPWPSVECLAMRIVHFAADKRRLIPLARASVEFARSNTQEKWLRSRIDWTLALYDTQARTRVQEATHA